MAVASDEPSENQTKQKMHRDMKHSSYTHGEKNMVYNTKKFAEKRWPRNFIYW